MAFDMDTISSKNDLDDATRPGDRKTNPREAFSCGIKQTSKAEDLDVLGQRIGQAAQKNEQVDDQIMERL
jgi:hypothetical protein